MIDSCHCLEYIISFLLLRYVTTSHIIFFSKTNHSFWQILNKKLTHLLETAKLLWKFVKSQSQVDLFLAIFWQLELTVYPRALRAQKLDGANLSRCGLSADLAWRTPIVLLSISLLSWAGFWIAENWVKRHSTAHWIYRILLNGKMSIL